MRGPGLMALSGGPGRLPGQEAGEKRFDGRDKVGGLPTRPQDAPRRPVPCGSDAMAWQPISGSALPREIILARKGGAR